MNLADDYAIVLSLLVMVGSLILFIRTAVGFSSTPGLPLEICGATLRIDGDRFGGPVTLSKLRLDEAREVEFSVDQALRPVHRPAQTDPARINLVTRQSGWFILHNGQRALVYLTPRQQVLYIPTLLDYVLLVSVEDSAQFIATLRQH